MRVFGIFYVCLQFKYLTQNYRRMQSINTKTKPKQLIGLEDSSLFMSPHCRENVIQNFKLNTLFRKSKLKPIDLQQESSNSRRLRESAHWLEQISYVTETQVYQPKKICDYAAEEEKQNALSRILNSNNSSPNQKRNYKTGRQEQKSSGQVVCQKSIGHRQECFMKRMKTLGKPKKQTIMEKQTQMKSVWPKLNYRSMNQSFQKLKCINISDISSAKLPFKRQFLNSKPILPPPATKSREVTSLHIERGCDYIPSFLLSVLHQL